MMRNPKKLKRQSLDIRDDCNYSQELYDNIRANGVQTPILINNRNEIIDGLKRKRIAIQLGIKLVPVERQKFMKD